MSNEVMVNKVTLSTGKVVLLRQLQIKHQQLAAEAAQGNSDNELANSIAIQNELIKILIAKIGDKVMKPADLEDLDAVLSFVEYREITSVVKELMGDSSNVGKPKIEFVATGEM